MIKPFKAYRPSAEWAATVSARASGNESNEEIQAFLKSRPQSYLHVVKPHLSQGQAEKRPDHFEFAAEYLQKLISEQRLVEESASSIYVYKQTKLSNNQSFTGIITTVSVDDYLNGKIKKHENTRTQKEQELAQHIEVVKAIGEPVLLTFHPDYTVDKLLQDIVTTQPEFDFESEHALRHQIWVVNDPARVQPLVAAFGKMDAFYIADGHHRSAGAARFGENRRKEQAVITGDESFNYFLACLIPADQLHIVAFHRLVKDLNGQPLSNLLTCLERDFDINELPVSNYEPDTPHTFGMYAGGKWFRLKLKPGKLETGNVLQNLDVSLLEQYILEPCLGITDSKTDERMAFMDGAKGVSGLIKLVNDGEFAVAFTLYPTQVGEVIAVADRGLTMPPKSTWIEPKMRTGMIIQKF